MESFTSNVFKIDPTDEAQVQKGCTLIRQVYEEIAPILNKVLDEKKRQFIEDRTRLEVERMRASGVHQDKEIVAVSSSTLANVSGDDLFNNSSHSSML